ncbi:MAG: MFS transporter [Puia sp.]
MIGAAFGLGFIIGPAIGGLLTGWGIRAPFYAAAILTLLNWLYGYFVLPESLSRENRRKFELKKALPLEFPAKSEKLSRSCGIDSRVNPGVPGVPMPCRATGVILRHTGSSGHPGPSAFPWLW